MVKYSTLLGAAGVASAFALPKAGALAKNGLVLRDAVNNTVADPIPVNQITNKNIHLGPDNVLYSVDISSAKDAPAGPITINLVNNFAGGSVNAYLTGLDQDGQVAFWRADGSKFNPTNPDAGNQAPVQLSASDITIALGGSGSTTPVSLPEYVTSGRIYFAAGDLYFGVNHGDSGPALVQPSALASNDPSSNVNWGFSEFTWNSQQLFANISFVDFVGLVIALALQPVSSGGLQEVKGLPASAITTLCQDLNTQAQADGQIWDQLCVVDSNQQPLRVLSPNSFTSSGQGFQDYWTQYVEDVYNSFASSPLTINTQGAAGDVQGTYNSGTGNIEFATGGSFPKPSAADIFGCNSGPFANEGDDAHKAIVARLCAAFNRSTLKLDGGATQPDGTPDPSTWYGQAPTNFYSKFVHAQELDGRGYAFAYDDVHGTSSPDIAGTVSAGDPQTLTLTVGGVSS